MFSIGFVRLLLVLYRIKNKARKSIENVSKSAQETPRKISAGKQRESE
jgi:hypothetical protein